MGDEIYVLQLAWTNLTLNKLNCVCELLDFRGTRVQSVRDQSISASLYCVLR